MNPDAPTTPPTQPEGGSTEPVPPVTAPPAGGSNTEDSTQDNTGFIWSGDPRSTGG